MVLLHIVLIKYSQVMYVYFINQDPFSLPAILYKICVRSSSSKMITPTIMKKLLCPVWRLLQTLSETFSNPTFVLVIYGKIFTTISFILVLHKPLSTQGKPSRYTCGTGIYIHEWVPCKHQYPPPPHVSQTHESRTDNLLI